MAERLITTEYSGKYGDKVGHAASIEGAMRAAIIRIAHGQYSSATIYDARFGYKSLALTIIHGTKGIDIKWPRTPKWRFD